MITSHIIAIVGETGSGKTALAVELAKRFNGEIIAADSRTVYAGMDIGTAKPTIAERAGISHYGFDVVGPNEQFTAFDFKQLAQKAIADISGRDKLPIVVGGTGLYVDALIYDFQFRPKPDVRMRAALENLSVAELKAKIVAAGLLLPDNDDNPRHLARLLESGEPPQQLKKLSPNTLVLGLSVPRAELEGRIAKRVDAMLTAGLLGEVKSLYGKYGDHESFRTPGYGAMIQYIKDDISLEEAKRQFVRDDMRLAKRQRTWFKRNKDIQWLSGDGQLEQATALTTAFLAK